MRTSTRRFFSTGFGPQAAAAVPHVLAALGPPLTRCDYPLLRRLIRTLEAISPDARQAVRGYFAERDPTLGRLALDMFDGR